MALCISGCSTNEAAINGEYKLDREYMFALSMKCLEQMQIPDFDIQERKDEIRRQSMESLEKKDCRITIDYPTFEVSKIHDGDQSPTTTISQIKKTEGNEYIIIDESGVESDLVVTFNKADGSLTGESIKLIRR